MDKMTPRQRQVIDLVAQGYTERQIALKLQIAVRTVKWHKADARRRTGYQSSVPLAVQYALEAQRAK